MIVDMNVYLPDRVVFNAEIEAAHPLLPSGSLERLFGIKQRHYAATTEQVSDMAAAAARPILERHGSEGIDFMIFAAACSDLIEPATANIVQHKLGLNCPVMDIKNACNSFTTGLMTATQLIAGGMCRKVLVVNGEKLSDSVRPSTESSEQLMLHLAAFSFGDAGAAALVSTPDQGSGFVLQRFRSLGNHWQLCTIPGGGSLHPHNPDKMYFEGYTTKLKEVMEGSVTDFLHDCLAEAGWQPADINHVFTHQVSGDTARLASQAAQVPITSVEQGFDQVGNTAAASIPLAIHRRMAKGDLKRGDKVVILGLAAGVSISVQLIIW
jgi:acyl-CoA:acyl-CoA alkyltransferase